MTGKRAIDKVQSYEGALLDVYGNVPYAERQYTTIVNGQRVNGVADNVTIVNEQRTAVEAKFVEDWSSSLRNPASSVGSKPWSAAEQTKMVDQARNTHPASRVALSIIRIVQNWLVITQRYFMSQVLKTLSL